MKRHENWKCDGGQIYSYDYAKKYVQFENYEKYLYFVSLTLLATPVLRGLIGSFSSNEGVCIIVTDKCLTFFVI